MMKSKLRWVGVFDWFDWAFYIMPLCVTCRVQPEPEEQQEQVRSYVALLSVCDTL